MNARVMEQTASRKRDPEEKRRLLLKSARTLFVDKGFEASTTKLIAERAGVSEGILYHQFDSKIGLLSALVEEFTAIGAKKFLSVEHNKYEAELVIRSVVAFVDSDRALFHMIYDNQKILRANGVPTVRDYLVPAIEGRLRERIEEGICFAGDPKVMAEIEFSVVEAVYLGWLKSNSKKIKEAFITEGVRALEAINSID